MAHLEGKFLFSIVIRLHRIATVVVAPVNKNGMMRLSNTLKRSR